MNAKATSNTNADNQQSPYALVMTALHGGCPRTTPFTVYDEKLPKCARGMELISRGIGIVKRITSYSIYHPNVKVEEISFTDDRGRQMVRCIYSTPHGDLSTLVEPVGFTTWRHEYLFKTPDDYKALLFFIQDSVAQPNYDYAASVLSE